MPAINPQGFAVELYFDTQMEAQVFAFRQSIYKLGVKPVLGKLGDKPHVSLAVFSNADPDLLKQVTLSFSKQIHGFSTQLDAIGIFPTADNVIYLTPIPTSYLLEIHKEFHRILKKEKLESSPYYLPEKWVPHSTLESNLPDEQLDLALRLIKQHFTPICGSFAALGVISFRPIHYLAEYPLKE